MKNLPFLYHWLVMRISFLSILCYLFLSSSVANMGLGMTLADGIHTHPLLLQVVDFEKSIRLWIYYDQPNQHYYIPQTGVRYPDGPGGQLVTGGLYKFKFDFFPRSFVIGGGLYGGGVFAHIQFELLRHSSLTLNLGYTQGSDLHGLQLLSSLRVHDGPHWRLSPYIALQNRYFDTSGIYSSRDSFESFDVEEETLDLVCGFNVQYHTQSLALNGLIYLSRKHPLKRRVSSENSLDVHETQEPLFGLQTSIEW